MARRYTKKCSTSLITGGGTQIKTTMRYHLSCARRAPIKREEIANAGKDVEKRESLCTLLGGNINCYSHYAKQNGGSSKN